MVSQSITQFFTLLQQMSIFTWVNPKIGRNILFLSERLLKSCKLRWSLLRAYANGYSLSMRLVIFSVNVLRDRKGLIKTKRRNSISHLISCPFCKIHVFPPSQCSLLKKNSTI